MKVEVSCFVGGMVIKEIVHVDKFEDADKIAKLRNPFCRVVNRKVLINEQIENMILPPYFIDEKINKARKNAIICMSTNQQVEKSNLIDHWSYQSLQRTWNQI